MNGYRLGAMLAALSMAACLSAPADPLHNPDGKDPDAAGVSRSLTSPAPTTQQIEPSETGNDKLRSNPRDDPSLMLRPSPQTPDAADLTDEEAEAIRKATQ